MKLPGIERAVVEQARIRDYLLSEAHPVGRFKAPVFRQVGYSLEHWEVLADDLRRLVSDNERIGNSSGM